MTSERNLTDGTGDTVFLTHQPTQLPLSSSLSSPLSLLYNISILLCLLCQGGVMR